MQPPSGTVTFLFTDVEGSTRLWEERPEEMRSALEEHDGIVRGAIEAHGGYVFSTGGDGFAAAFGRAEHAVDAAAKAQAGLANHPFLRVRMGVHIGEVQERDGDYFGPAVNQAARVMSAGHGGQVLVSATAAAVLGGGDLVDLGECTLSGLSSPVQVFQLGSNSFPVLRSADMVTTNLPAERTVFVGRDRELANLERLTDTTRVITLTGVGGVGKTRLAIQTAAQLLGEFRDGVWLVELAPLIDEVLVPAQVASAIRAPVRAGEDTSEALCRFLAHKRALLVLDNCEHVLDATAALVDRLVDAAPRVTVVATSREPLGVNGERVVRVPSLGVEASDGSAGDAVELFVTRAAQAHHGFALDATNGDAVFQVCRRLDGIPLAIELAAARVNVLPVDQIAVRLDERFRLLTRGGRTAVPRQQTLQGAIDWSYELLGDAERDLFDTLGVFAGDFDLDAASTVAGIDEFDALDVIQGLVDKSMIEPDIDHGRYRLLETLRQYSWDRLIDHGTLDETRGRHACYYATLVAEQTGMLRTPGQQTQALDRLDADYDNLRAALAHLIETGDADTAVTMVLPLVYLFNIRHPREGFGWFQAVIAIADDLTPPLRAQLLANASFAAMNVGDYPSLRAYAQAAIDLAGTDTPAIAYLHMAIWHDANGDPERSLDAARQGIDAAHDDPTMLAMANQMVLLALAELGEEAEVRELVPRFLALAEQVANPLFTPITYTFAADALVLLDHPAEARPFYERALAMADAGGPHSAVLVRTNAALATDDPDIAVGLLRVALPRARDELAGLLQANVFVPAAKILDQTGHEHVAALLLGAYQRSLEDAGVRGQAKRARPRDELLHALEQTLGTDDLAAALDQGRQLTNDQATQLAIDTLDRPA